MVICFVLFLTAVVCVLLLGRSLLWALLIGLALFFGLGLHRGYAPKALCRMAWRKGREALIVVPIFLLIGAITALWRASGTISFFLYYGLVGLTPRWFILVAFLLSLVLSFALGSSYGVTGTAGVILITLARSGGVSVAVTAGAILSGAYFGDRCSPMSSCASLVATCTGTALYRNVREMLKTAALPTLLSVGVYAVLSLQNPITTVDAGVLSALRNSFTLSWWVLLPAALMVVLPLVRVPIKLAMLTSAVTALILAVWLQHLPVLPALEAAILGYAPTQPELAGILSGGGVISMLSAAGIVFVTSLYAGILEGIDALNPSKRWVEGLADRVGLFPTTAILSVLVVMIFCNQSVMTIMDAQLLEESYRRRGASSTELAIDIANSGVTLSGLIPWSIAVSVPLQMLDADISAIPYAALLYLIPICYLFTRKFFTAGQRTVPAGARS